jgi:hypothetical protein
VVVGTAAEIREAVEKATLGLADVTVKAFDSDESPAGG